MGLRTFTPPTISISPAASRPPSMEGAASAAGRRDRQSRFANILVEYLFTLLI